jgi:3-deoxy-D-arabino-heptulosonate 7-phosphate (DAHP) synthase class II
MNLDKLGYFKKIKEFMQNTHKKPVALIGRIAGQYAKPRSN